MDSEGKYDKHVNETFGFKQIKLIIRRDEHNKKHWIDAN